MPRGIRLVAQPATKVPFQPGQLAATLFEDGKYKAWYTVGPSSNPEPYSTKDKILPGHGACVAYAESTGGVTSSEAALAMEGSGPEFIVESRAGGQHHDAYSEVGTLYDSTAKSSAQGVTAGTGSRWAYMNRGTYGVKKAVYRFIPAITGFYHVFATWPSASNASSRIEHIVACAGETASVVLDQNSSTNPGGANNWNLLGRYGLTAGVVSTVTQTNENYSDSAVFRADAVKWVLVEVSPSPPEITQHPQSRHAAAGTTVVFSVAATGEGTLVYRWQKDGTDLDESARYSGAATSMLTIASAEQGDEGRYRCRVSNAGVDTFSGEAVLTVGAAGDLDRDQDVDLADFSLFQNCFNGPNRSYGQAGCEDADYDWDHDVDLVDFRAFSNCFNGPNRPAACED